MALWGKITLLLFKPKGIEVFTNQICHKILRNRERGTKGRDTVVAIFAEVNCFWRSAETEEKATFYTQQDFKAQKQYLRKKMGR